LQNKTASLQNEFTTPELLQLFPSQWLMAVDAEEFFVVFPLFFLQ